MGQAQGQPARSARCIALVGPYLSGKTTLLEAILARTGAITTPVNAISLKLVDEVLQTSTFSANSTWSAPAAAIMRMGYSPARAVRALANDSQQSGAVGVASRRA